MDFLLLIFLSGIFLPNTSNQQSNVDEGTDGTPSDEEQYYSDEQNTDNNPPAQEQEKSMESNYALRKLEGGEDTFANEKTGSYYKHIKQYVFSTKSRKNMDSELSVTATTNLKFALKSYKLAHATRKYGSEEEEHSYHHPHKHVQTSTPNVPEFWTMLAKAISGRAMRWHNKDEFFQPIPVSDLNASSRYKPSELEELKLKLMLGISLMTLILFLPLLILCFAVLFKLRDTSDKTCDNQYPVNPELASMSYFHPSEGISSTSFSKSGDSSSNWGFTSSELRRSITQDTSSKSTYFSPSSDQTVLNEQSSCHEEELTFLLPEAQQQLICENAPVEAMTEELTVQETVVRNK